MDEEELFILTITIDLIITAFAYLIVPIITRLTSKENFSKKEARQLAFNNSIVIYLIFTFIHLVILKEGKIAKIAPASFYGFISYYILKQEKKINNNNKSNNDTEYSIENTTEINIDVQKENEQSIIESKEMNNNTDEFTKETNKPKHKKALPFLIIALCIETIILCYVFAYTQELKTDLNNKQNQINTLNTTVINQKVDYEEIWDLREQVDFMNKYIVIVPSNTNVYHKYGCQYLDTSSFSAFNITNAKGQGYVACTHCIK